MEEKYKGFNLEFYNSNKSKLPYSIYTDIDDFINKNIYKLDAEEKIGIVSMFIDSIYFTNNYDRIILSFLLNNSKNIDKIIFVEHDLSFKLCYNNLIYYDFNRIIEGENTSIAFYCKDKDFNEINNMYKMEAIEYLLETYDRIFLSIPFTKDNKDFLNSRLLYNIGKENGTK